MNLEVKRQTRVIQKASSQGAVSLLRTNSHSDCRPDFHRVCKC